MLQHVRTPEIGLVQTNISHFRLSDRNEPRGIRPFRLRDAKIRRESIDQFLTGRAHVPTEEPGKLEDEFPTGALPRGVRVQQGRIGLEHLLAPVDFRGAADEGGRGPLHQRQALRFFCFFFGAASNASRALTHA